MTAQLAPNLVFRGVDNANVPLAGGLLYSYAAGTVIPQATYVDSTQTTQNTNPVVLNARGECALWLDPTLAYKFLLTDSLGNTIPGWPVDNVPGIFNPSASIIPAVTNTYNLGSSSFTWANGYFGTQLYIGGVPVLNSGNISYWAQTAAEIAAGVQPTNYAYAPGNVLRYGADRTGTTDSSVAWNSALTQRQQGGEQIFFPSGFYKGNFTVTGQDIVIILENPAYEDLNTVGFTANNAANPVWSIGDGTTLTSSIRFQGGLKMHGQGTAQKGLLFNGVQNCWIDGLIVRGFTSYCVNYTASNTRPSSYVFIRNYRIDAINGGASAIGFVITQPANFPTSYASAVFFDSGAIQSVAGTLWGVQINSNSTIWVSNSYWTMVNNIGINFSDAGNSGAIICSNLEIDTGGTSNDVLITCAGTQPIQQYMQGSVSVNGKISINGVVSTAALGSQTYLPFRSMMLYPSVTGTIDFQDNAASSADKTAAATQSCAISRSGSNFFIANSGGAVITQSSILDIQNAAANGDGILQFASTGIQILTGAGAPAATKPLGTLYLRTDASSTTTRLYISLGAGTWANFTSSA